MSTSNWIHAICEGCWYDKYDKMPVRVSQSDRHLERCCFCGEATASGIYTRASLNETRCGGIHSERAVFEKGE